MDNRYQKEEKKVEKSSESIIRYSSPLPFDQDSGEYNRHEENPIDLSPPMTINQKRNAVDHLRDSSGLPINS